MMSIRRALLLVLLALPLTAVVSPAGEPAKEKTLAVSFGLDIGDIDEEFGGVLIEPFVSIGQHGLGFNWDARLRGVFTDKDEGISTSGAEARGLVGWSWQWTDAIGVSALGGGRAGIYRIDHDEDVGGGAYDLNFAAAEVGVGAKITGTEGLDLVGQFTVGPVLMYSDESDNDAKLGASYVFEAYLGVDWHLPQYAMTVSVGALYDRLDVDVEDVAEDTVMERIAVHVGLTVKF
jgi:hypothetical protein